MGVIEGLPLSKIYLLIPPAPLTRLRRLVPRIGLHLKVSFECEVAKLRDNSSPLSTRDVLTQSY